MTPGYYTAVSGLVTSVRRMEIVTHNLANTQTPGYKQERAGAATFSEQLFSQLAEQTAGPQLGRIALSTVAEAPELDLSQGSLQRTGRELDIALQGEGFLAVAGQSGTAYTRDGSLVRDGLGFLATANGSLVLGENGPIALGDGPVTFRPDGAVLVSDQVVDRLRVLTFAPGQQMDRLGNNQLVARDGALPVASEAQVHQGFVESSNVDLTATMTTMMEVQRAYESNQRMIQIQDELMSRAATSIAQPAG